MGAIYSQIFNQAGTPSGWTVFGNGTWNFDGSDATQTAVGASDPQTVLYTQDSFNANRTVQATVTFDTVDLTGSDQRIGICVLGRSSDGQGIHLFWNTQAGGQLRFLYDGIEWTTGPAFVVTAGNSYYFKAMYAQGVFYGKAWLVGNAEPAWQLTYVRVQPSGFVHSGISGNITSLLSKASYDDFTITESITPRRSNNLRPRIFGPGLAR